MPPNLTIQQVNAIMHVQREREAADREGIRQVIAATPPPLPSELVQRFLHLFDGHVREMMRSHAGFDLSERRASYLTSLDIFERSVGDLISAIDDFSAYAIADGASIFERQNEPRLRAYESRIQKELFATTNAALALVEHSRHIEEISERPDHDARRISAFGDDGLHAFVQALRVVLFHVHMVEAGYNLTTSYSEKKKTATFAISRETLLRVLPGANITQRSAVMSYVNACSASIDLKPMFVDYLARVRTFHAWFQNELKSESLVALRDYDRIMQEKDNFNQRSWWKLMLNTWKNSATPPNPHRHLHKYLTPDQMVEVNVLPLNSREQVDLIIRCVDKGNAIDDELRELAYEWFARPPMDDPVTPKPSERRPVA
ncbi:MAG: hypothetical protein ACT4O6_09785 [Reyranella sp.]